MGQGDTMNLKHMVSNQLETQVQRQVKKLRDVNLDPGEYETSEIIRASERVRKEDETLRASRRKIRRKVSQEYQKEKRIREGK